MEYAGWWIVWLVLLAALIWFAWRQRPARGRERRYRSLKHYGENDPMVSSWAGDRYQRGAPGERRPDARIAEDVTYGLSMDGEVDATRVQVEAHDGRVTLNGVVKSRHEKRLAAEIADAVPGVAGVDNRLRVAGGGREPRPGL